MSITIKDIAKALSISPATVSLALNGNPIVADETAKKVREAAQNMGYVPNRNARNLVNSRSDIIALILPQLGHDYYAKLTQLFVELFETLPYRLVIAVSNEKAREERRLVQHFVHQNVRAILLMPINDINDDQEYFEELNDCPVPLVFVSTKYAQVRRPLSGADLCQGMRDITEHVLQQNVESILFMGGAKETYAFGTREQGFLDAVARRDVEYCVERVVLNTKIHSFACLMEPIEKIRKDCKSAIICVNDELAAHALNMCIQRGFSIPDQLMISGFDDSNICSLTYVPITSVHYSFYQIVQNAYDLMQKLIEDPSAQLEDILVPCQVVVCQSTAG